MRFRLTDKGREQAKVAGEYIRKNIATSFDKYYSSEFIRFVILHTPKIHHFAICRSKSDC
jgi:broad specificity phosphatase PhoE